MNRAHKVLGCIETLSYSNLLHRQISHPLRGYYSSLYPFTSKLNFRKSIRITDCHYFRRCVITVSNRLMATTTEGGASNNDTTRKDESDFKNKLANERSPYLLQHASNPVEWYPWGEEAFEKAKKEDKMIFLSVGYSTCHWCHVMERESFENPEVASVMNENFVNIKVDREERPDVDKIYMKFVQSTTGGGGWPMSVWLTPDLKPILGGTYFPPDDRYYGQPGFKTILSHIGHQWSENKDKVLEQGNRLLEIITQSMSLKQYSESGKEPPNLQCVSTCYSQLSNSYDAQFGGFDSAPKFPQPVNFNFLFRAYARNLNSEDGKKGLEMGLHTLKMMARGGIRDHVAQGFHRYSTDQFWHVPHFEKMLYDQGQLAVAYLDAYQISKDEEFADVARDILQYVSTDLSDQSGGFYSAEDADSLPWHDAPRKKEGAFCVWTEKEVRENLPQTVEGTEITLADVFCKYYNVLEIGNVDPYQDPHDELKMKNVLIVRKGEDECAQELNISIEVLRDALSKARKVLYDIRKQRPMPHLDDKFVASWNGLMISGFARAAQVLGDEKYASRAMEAAQFIYKHMYNTETGELLRSAYKGGDGTVAQILTPIPGVLEDYTFLVRGLLDLYEASYDAWCIEWAHRLQTMQDNLFWDTIDGGYFNSVSTDASIVLRLKEDQDGAEPNPNSVAVTNLLRLANMLEETTLREKAHRVLSLYSHRLLKLPLALPEMICGLMYYAVPTKQIIITGDESTPGTQELLQCIHRQFLPFKTLILCNAKSKEVFKAKLEGLNLPENSENATAYVCQNNTCSLPVTSSAELEKLLLENSTEV